MPNNQDVQQLEHFNRHAQQWWDPHGPLATLHHINPARMAFVERHVDLNGKRVADIGCGGGLAAEAMARKGAEVVGIDMACDAIEIARLHALESGLDIDYRCTSAESLAAQEPGEFDIVTCLDMLEHVPQPAEIVRASAQLLKPGGWAFFSTLNRTFKARLLAIGAAEHLLGLVPQGTHEFDKFIKPHELDHWARASGLSLRDEAGLCYNPLARQAHLCDDLSINYLMAFQKDA